MWWILLLASLTILGMFVAFGLLFAGGERMLIWGVGIGSSVVLLVAFLEFPPAAIENWRQGAEGERRTAKALRPLTRRGWALLNDIPTERGNIDHILVGPAGVFLLETKNLSGALSVRHGVLCVVQHHDPDDRREDYRVAAGVRRRANQLSRRLAHCDLPAAVQPVVVLWGRFEQESLLSKGVAWIDGKALAERLSGRQAILGDEILGDDEVRQIAEAIREAYPTS